MPVRTWFLHVCLVASAESAREVAEKSAEALKKQAEGLSAKYARLAREKEAFYSH